MELDLHYRLKGIEATLKRLLLLGVIEMKEMDDLTAAVKAETDLDDSIKTALDGVVAYIQTIPSLIAAAGADPVKLQALTTQITSNSAALKAGVDTLAAAVTANTPVA